MGPHFESGGEKDLDEYDFGLEGLAFRTAGILAGRGVGFQPGFQPALLRKLQTRNDAGATFATG